MIIHTEEAKCHHTCSPLRGSLLGILAFVFAFSGAALGGSNDLAVYQKKLPVIQKLVTEVLKKEKLKAGSLVFAGARAWSRNLFKQCWHHTLSG